MKYLTIIWILLATSVSAQDIHFSQFYATPQNLNPALTGVFDGDIRLTTSYRNQWFTVPVPYMTFTVGTEQKFSNIKGLTGGLLFNYDQAGDAALSLTQLNGSLAYRLQLAHNHAIHSGIQLGIGQRRFDASSLTLDEQFIDGLFIPTAQITETFNQTSKGFTNISAGINWHFRLGKRLQFKLGTAFYHINQPNVGFWDNAATLPTKWNLNAEGIIQIAPKLDFMPSVLFSRQGMFHERVFGSFFKYHINTTPYQEMGILLGTWYRMNDAAIAVIGVQYPTWQAGISYDLTTSSFSEANNGVGAVEFSFIYIITKVPPLPQLKTCPIF